jgi:hypothetical protein
MNPLFASHTMPSLGEMLTLGPCLIAAASVLAFPVIAAGSGGSRSAARLPPGRHLLAVLAGSGLGLIVSAGLAIIVIAMVPPGWINIFGIAASAAAGTSAAFASARFVASKLSWYACRGCGIWFRAWSRSEYCPGCDRERDRLAMADALAGFNKRFEQTQLRQ